MGILVDGYNLLFTIGLPRDARGPRALENARRSLLDFLLVHLEPSEISSTTVVFDAKHSARRGDSQFVYRGIVVRFAQDQDEADDLLELLIADCPTPGKLLVVSSDRRVQTAARRRHAMIIGSEPWLEVLRQRTTSDSSAAPPDHPQADRRQRAPSADEIQLWLDEFGENRSVSDWEDKERQAPRPDETDRTDFGWGPFPPGYGEDLS